MHTGYIFTINFLEAFESNTISDWLNHMVYLLTNSLILGEKDDRLFLRMVSVYRPKSFYMQHLEQGLCL